MDDGSRKSKAQIDWQLQELRTDYIDYGFIHCLDADSDWKEYQENGVLDYLLNMKKDGVVRYIGLSSLRQRFGTYGSVLEM